MLKHRDVDTLLRALAEPTRRAIIERLSQSPATVGELAKPFDMSLAAVMQHLAVLEAAGIVASEKTGRVRVCRLEPGGHGRARPLDRSPPPPRRAPSRPAGGLPGGNGKDET